MTQNKKISSILLLLALSAALLLLGACAGAGEADTTAADTTADTSADTTVDTDEDTQPPCEHALTEWIVDTPATCTAEGAKHLECSTCGTTLESAVIATVAHAEQNVAGVAATCTETGLTDGKICSVCNTTLIAQTVIEALDHTESGWIVDTLASIGITGSKHTECTRCGDTLKTEEIPALEESHQHVGVEWTVTLPAKCNENGLSSFLCACGEVMATAPIAKADHTEVTVPGTAATCTAAGTTDGTKCSECQQTLQSQLPIPPLGHTFENGTCTTCGTAEPFGIWIVDGIGNPVSDVIVKVMQGDTMIAMHSYAGEYLDLQLEIGTYTLVLDLSQTGANYTYDASVCTISPEKRSATVRLIETPEEGDLLYVSSPLDADYTPYVVGVGAYNIPLTPNGYTFLLFRPTVSAIYTFTYECDAALTIGYHGGSFFAQGNDLSADTESISAYENGISMNVYGSEIGNEFVLSIRSFGATSCILKIENAGDAGTRLVDEPWIPYLEDEDVVAKQLASNPTGTYTTVDLTDLTLSAVLNREDGYYHLNSADGPVIYIDLTTASPYVASIQTICANQRMGAYIKDAEGKVAEKRSYNELFYQYGMPEDATPVDTPLRVPLTEKIAEAIIAFGNNNSWWAEGSDVNIFTPVHLLTPYNRDYAWLLYCGYYA